MIDHRTAPYGALLLRLSLAALFILHLYRKFYVTGYDVWWNNLVHNGYSTPIIYYTMSVETVAPVLLFLGLFSRWIALYSIPMMIGAAQYWAVRKGFYFTNAGAEAPAIWAVGLAIQALLGDGALSIGALVFPWAKSQRRFRTV